MNLPDYLLDTPRWLQGGKGQGIILSSRVRLARNLTNHPFPSHAKPASKRKVVQKIREALTRLDPAPEFITLETMDKIEYGYLLEKRLISTQMLRDPKHGAIAIWRGSGVSATINEDDHLRLQAIEPGIMIDRAFRSVWELDRQIQRHLPVATNRDLGYVTSSPTNVGTGMRVSLFCHLPGMAMSGQIEETLAAMIPSGIGVRGFFGAPLGVAYAKSSPDWDGLRHAVLGNIFQISNQTTLGLSEGNILSRVQSICDALIQSESEARRELLASSEVLLMDRVCRSYGMLCNVRTLGFPEFVAMLSNIRLGMDCLVPTGMAYATPTGVADARHGSRRKWIEGMSHRQANRLMMQTQPAHLVQAAGRMLSESEADFQRAEIVRQAFRRTRLLLP